MSGAAVERNTFKKHVHRTYLHGGLLRYQNGYHRKDGTPVSGHFKTWPDNKTSDNRKAVLGY
jgi:hypothetical protein